MTNPVIRVAVDSGGTFTDFVALFENGERQRFKVPSTPNNPSEAIFSGLDSLGLTSSTPILHGTTVATNALLEAKGARVGIVTSRGFRDVHELRRQRREELFELEPSRFPCLVSGSDVYEIDLRLDPEGKAIGSDHPSTWVSTLPPIVGDLDIVVVSLIHGYRRVDLEKQIAGHIEKRFPRTLAMAASELVPYSREYERIETAISNAFVYPRMRHYLRSLKQSTYRQWAIMESSGGLMSVDEAIEEPIRTAISGPAGGVAAAQSLLPSLGASVALTLDMGGTSTDIALIAAEESGRTEGSVGGRPLRVPMLPIETIGAGGGSIGKLDAAGVLTVGPESAGAFPGPACYGRDEQLRPTLTDAHVCLGTIESLLGGTMALDRGRANAALRTLITPECPTETSVAKAMIQIANANIIRAVRGLAARSTHRLDDAVLFAFGGAGGLHACEIADVLDIPRVYFPDEPGVFSAEGIADAPFIHWYSKALHSAIRSSNELKEEVESIVVEGRAQPHWPKGESVEEVLIADCHYLGQSHTLPLEIPFHDIGLRPNLNQEICESFHAIHERSYGYRNHESSTILIANLRLKARVSPWPDRKLSSSDSEGVSVDGPAVVTSYGSTLRLPVGWSANPAPQGGYICTKKPTNTSSITPPLEAFRLELISIAEEMGATLKQASYSPNIKERRDYSCAVFSRSGDLLAQAAHIPVHLGSQSESVRAALHSGILETGASVILNDPYDGGTHLPDITLISPVFANDALAFLVASRAHHADVGGPYPGSMPVPFDAFGNPIPLTIDDEGIRLPPTRMSAEVREHIIQASRTPSERDGDLRAQEAANRIGQVRLNALISARSSDIFNHADELLEFGRRQALALIEAFPEGVFQAEDALEDDGHGQAVAIRLRVQRVGPRLIFDFRQSDPQTQSSLNAVRAVTVAAVYYTLKLIGGPRLPANEGVLRQLDILTSSGTICDASYPAAVSAGNVETSQRIVDVVMTALSRCFPDKVPANSCGSMNNVILAGEGFSGEPFVHYETHGGGLGAGPSGPGLSGTHSHMTNTLNTPVEELELSYPLRVKEYRLAEPILEFNESRFAGGRGLIRTYTFLKGGTATLIGERHVSSPACIGTEAPVQRAEHTLIRLDGARQRLGSKVHIEVAAGESVELKTAGGGHWMKRN